jgi:predicted double-glycine peptidase
MVRQRYDISCGAAAMATLLKYFYGVEVSERTAMEDMLELGDAEMILKRGFSMLELKHYAESRGFVAEGFKIEKAEDLKKLRVPVITLITVRDYNHFVVLKEVRSGKVIISDPAFGNTTKSLAEFDKRWGHVILAVLSRKQSGDSKFVADYSINAPMSEINLLVHRGSPTLRPSPGEF